MSSLGLNGYNKSFLCAAVRAPASSHDVRMLKSTLQKFFWEKQWLWKAATIFHLWQSVTLSFLGIHGFKRDTMKTQLTKNTFDKKLRSAQVVTEHAYGMLKYRWRILHKKNECRLHNLKCVIMPRIMLNYSCIKHNDPCEPRWRLEAKKLRLMTKRTTRAKDKNKSVLIRLKISSQSWSM